MRSGGEEREAMGPAEQSPVNQIICTDALEGLRRLPDGLVHCAITSPPYWRQVDYGFAGQIGQEGYAEYLARLLQVWRETERVLAPNGKLCINVPIMPMPKRVLNEGHTRTNISLSHDIEHQIVTQTDLRRFSLYIWQKQTTEKMFGSYPYPPNLYEQNTIEFINVFVKQGQPRRLSPQVKERSRLTTEEWMDLTRQVWNIYPEDVKRQGGHPAPFPVELPTRVLRMYTFAAVPEADFEGDVVLDMFNIGIDAKAEYCQAAQKRLAQVEFGEVLKDRLANAARKR